MAIPVAQDEKSIVHFLNRGGFGPTTGQIAQVKRRGLENYLRDQLDAAPDPEVEKRIARFGDQSYSVTEMFEIYRGKSPLVKKDQPLNGIMPMLDNFYTTKIFRAAASESQLHEVLVDFWYNHFNVSRVAARWGAIAYEREAIRPNIRLRFRDLIGATAKHPAMLFYLDNYLNRRNEIQNGRPVRGINENYGREVLELHTLGVDAGYKETDVVNAARVFSGWGLDHPHDKIDLGTGVFVFKPEEHDRQAKTVFGLEFPAGGGREEGEKLLDYLSVHPATAHFISTKLARRFVADDPPESLVERCAQTFLSTKGDLKKVVTTLFESPEFWAASPTPRFRTPFEFVIACLRATGASVDTAVPGLMDALGAMGMKPYYCVPPTGYPDRGADWLSPAYLHRFRFALALAEGRVSGVRVRLGDVVKVSGGDAADPVSIATVLNREIFGGGLSSATIEAASAITPGASAFTRMMEGALGTAHPLKAQPAALASKVVGLILASPEMQMR
ncbi:MAG: DUF1800 domain-containing protein [Vicinamibacteria bacterium]